MIAALIVLACIVAVLLIALVFARPAAVRAGERAAMDLARAMEAEIKRTVAQKKKQLDDAADTAIAGIKGKSDDELQAEINK